MQRDNRIRLRSLAGGPFTVPETLLCAAHAPSEVGAGSLGVPGCRSVAGTVPISCRSGDASLKSASGLLLPLMADPQPGAVILLAAPGGVYATARR
jgi:hypothetical protein